VSICDSAVLQVVILSVCPPVRLSVCLSHACIVTKVNDVLQKAITLLLWHQQRLVGDALFPLKYSPKVTHPFEKSRLRQISAYNVSTVRDSE